MTSVNARSPEYYLGIDPSARGTALALRHASQDGNLSRETHLLHIQPPDNFRGGRRLLYIHECGSEFLSGVPHLTKTCMESASLYSTNRETVLSEVRGVLLLLVAQKNCETQMVPPTTLKQFAAGNGGASKEEVMAAIRGGGIWEPRNDDEGDACGLCDLSFALANKDTAPLTRNQLELVMQLLDGKPLKPKLVKPKRTFDV